MTILRPLLLLAAFLLTLFAMLPVTARADFINLSGAENSRNIAEIYVLDDHVRVVLEIFPEDLFSFQQIMPDELFGELAVERAPEVERLREFADRGFQVIDAEGRKLPVEVGLVEPRMRIDRVSPFAGMRNPMTGQVTPGAPEDKRVVYAELRYAFGAGPRPAQLRFVPPLEENGRAAVGIGFIAFHKAVPVIDFRFLSAEATLTLDWEDPWYSKFGNPNLKRHHKSALMSFLYVEPYEVRHEVLTRVKDLEAWMDLGLRGDEYIELDELAPLKQRVEVFLLQKNAVRIDGELGKPILDRSSYIKVGISGIQILDQPERMEISTAIVGVIFAFITEGIPQEVTVDWELFTDQIQQVPAMMTDPAGPLPYVITPDDSLLTWTNFLKTYELPQVRRVELADELRGLTVPLVSAGCLLFLMPLGFVLGSRRRRGQPVGLLWAAAAVLAVGALLLSSQLRVVVPMPVAAAPRVSEEDGKVILQGVLENVYRAFDFREEEDVYDKLSLSVEGELLAEVYLQNRKSFAVKKAGGAQAKVKKVEVQGVALRPVSGNRSALALDATWTAFGQVGHWGHVHFRRNRYEAVLTLEPVKGAWKLTGLDITNEERVQ